MVHIAVKLIAEQKLCQEADIHLRTVTLFRLSKSLQRKFSDRFSCKTTFLVKPEFNTCDT